MTITRAQKIRLGIFVVVSTTLLGAMFFVMVGTRLTRTEDIYFAHFTETVSGLEVGAPVKYSGVRIGSVASIEIDQEDVTRIVVTLSLRRGTPVKADSLVVLNTMGITGLKFVELAGGSNEAESLDPGAVITTGPSLLDRLTGKADIITEKIELFINNALAITGPEQQEQFKAALEHARNLLESTDGIMQRNDARIDQILDDLGATAATIKGLTIQVSEFVEKLDSRVEDLAGDVELLLLDLQLMVEEQNQLLAVLLEDADDTILTVKNLTTSPALQRTPRKVEETVAATLTLVQNADTRLTTLLTGLNQTSIRLSALMSDDRVEGILDSLQRLSLQLEGAVGTMDLTMLQSREDLFKTLSNLKDVVRNLNDFTQMLLENPSILLRGSQLKERN
jgi:ABC-type transporter Mla subunit MlaD